MDKSSRVAHRLPAPHPSSLTTSLANVRWDQLRVSGLEADIAYCEARLELVGKPRTLNQQAQYLTFSLLIRYLNRVLRHLLNSSAKQA